MVTTVSPVRTSEVRTQVRMETGRFPQYSGARYPHWYPQFRRFEMRSSRQNQPLRFPVFGGGRMSDTGRACAHASTSAVSQATRRPDNIRGFGNPPSRTRRFTLASESDTASATACRPRKIGFIDTTVAFLFAMFKKEISPGV